MNFSKIFLLSFSILFICSFLISADGTTLTTKAKGDLFSAEGLKLNIIELNSKDYSSFKIDSYKLVKAIYSTDSNGVTIYSKSSIDNADFDITSGINKKDEYDVITITPAHIGVKRVYDRAASIENARSRGYAGVGNIADEGYELAVYNNVAVKVPAVTKKVMLASKNSFYLIVKPKQNILKFNGYLNPDSVKSGKIDYVYQFEIQAEALSKSGELKTFVISAITKIDNNEILYVDSQSEFDYLYSLLTEKVKKNSYFIYKIK